jgi:homoserine dehydrogenase
VENDLVFTLHACPWDRLKTALKEIAESGCIAPHPAVFRIETFNS